MPRRLRWAVVLLTSVFLCLVLLQLVSPKLFHRCCSLRYARYFADDTAAKSRLASLRLPSHPRLPRLSSPAADLVVAIPTVYRAQVRHQYFHLTLWSLLEEAERSDVRLRVLVCSSQPNISGLPGYLSPLRGLLTIRHRPPPFEADVFDKEREDYVFCLREALRAAPLARHVLMLEDDAPVRRGGSPFFPTLRHLVARAERGGRRFAYLKLYHPPRLLGFVQPEWERHLEALAVAAILMTALAALWECGWRPRLVQVAMRHWRATAYCLLVGVYILDRHWILELRSLFVQTHLLVPASFCCTPGMVFQRRGALQAAEFMSRAQCDADYKKDELLFDFYRASGLRAWYSQPNLLEHVGSRSTLHDDGVKTLNL